jgi:4-hydroxy-tetrahydrodipicolinate synthase
VGDAGDFDGIYAALPTPFDDSGRVDQKALDHVIDYLCSREIRGIAALTEAAEDPLLLPDERRAMIPSILARVAQRKKVIINISAPATKEAVELAKLAHGKGATALMLTAYRLPGLGYRELYRHIDRIAKSADLPIMLNLRPDTVFDSLAPEELSTLTRHPALKAGFVPERASVIEPWVKRFKKRDGTVLSGSSLSFSGAHRAGASGSICGMAVIASAQAAKLLDAIQRKDNLVVTKLEKIFSPAVEMLGPPRSPEEMDGVQRLAAKLAQRPLEGFQMSPTVPFALIKEALRLQGHPVKNRVRPPYEQVGADVSERLKTTLKISEIIT